LKNGTAEEPPNVETAIYDVGDEIDCDSITDSDSELGNNFMAFKHIRMEAESDIESDMDMTRLNLKV